MLILASSQHVDTNPGGPAGEMSGERVEATVAKISLSGIGGVPGTWVRGRKSILGDVEG